MISFLYIGREVQISYDELRPIPPSEQLDYCLGQIAKNYALTPDIVAEIRSFYPVWKNNHHTLNFYKPHHVYPGKITLFRARSSQQIEQLLQLMNIHKGDEVEAEGWNQLTSQPLEIYDVPGNHLTILEEPNVRIVAEKLKVCLDLAGDGEMIG